MRLVEGAHAIRADLPQSSTHVVGVPSQAGDDRGTGVARLSSLRTVFDNQTQLLETITGTVLTIGGDCGVELASVAHVAAAHDVALLWFDAHADSHTPQTSPSSAFHGMVVRTLLGDGEPSLLPPTPLDPSRVVLVGTRAIDEDEAHYLDGAGPRVLSPADLTTESLLAAVTDSGATSVYIHVDLDVLDPAEFDGIGYPEPFGLTAPELLDLIRAVTARFPLVGAGVTEFAPSSEEHALGDMPTILRIIGALAKAG